jgi:hypothetical protein
MPPLRRRRPDRDEYDARMHAVINRISLKHPLEDEVYAAAQRDLPDRVAAIEGIHALYLVRSGDHDLLVVILGDSREAIDQMRDQIGNDWMRANVIPHATQPPDRVTGEVVTAFERH